MVTSELYSRSHSFLLLTQYSEARLSYLRSLSNPKDPEDLNHSSAMRSMQKGRSMRALICFSLLYITSLGVSRHAEYGTEWLESDGPAFQQRTAALGSV